MKNVLDMSASVDAVAEIADRLKEMAPLYKLNNLEIKMETYLLEFEHTRFK